MNNDKHSNLRLLLSRQSQQQCNRRNHIRAHLRNFTILFRRSHPADLTITYSPVTIPYSPCPTTAKHTRSHASFVCGSSNLSGSARASRHVPSPTATSTCLSRRRLYSGGSFVGAGCVGCPVTSGRLRPPSYIITSWGARTAISRRVVVLVEIASAAACGRRRHGLPAVHRICVRGSRNV